MASVYDTLPPVLRAQDLEDGVKETPSHVSM